MILRDGAAARAIDPRTMPTPAITAALAITGAGRATTVAATPTASTRTRIRGRPAGPTVRSAARHPGSRTGTRTACASTGRNGRAGIAEPPARAAEATPPP